METTTMTFEQLSKAVAELRNEAHLHDCLYARDRGLDLFEELPFPQLKPFVNPFNPNKWQVLWDHWENEDEPHQFLGPTPYEAIFLAWHHWKTGIHVELD